MTPLRLLSFALLLASTHLQASPPPAVPTSWMEFQASTNPTDQALVRNIWRQEWWKNCVALGAEERSGKNPRKKAAVQSYLVSEKFLNSVDLAQTGKSRPEIGQSTCGVLRLLGSPTKINYTKTAAHQRGQMVYRAIGTYVYTEAAADDGNGIVKSIQY